MNSFLNSLWVLIIAILLWQGFNYMVELDEDMAEYVGTSVRLNEEYHIIIDYSLLHKSYVLDNGVEVSYALVKN